MNSESSFVSESEGMDTIPTAHLKRMSTVESNLEGIQSHIASISKNLPKQIADVGEKMDKFEH